MDDYLRKLMINMRNNRASDLHLTAGSPVHYRVDNELVPEGDKDLTPDEVKDLVYSLLNNDQIRRFETRKELDFAVSIKDVARYRVNVFYQRTFIGCAIRIIPYEMMSIKQCGLPEDVVKKFCSYPRGLVLVTGSTGSGKSTTLAAMVEEINKSRKCHIVTVEDPLEFVHNNRSAIIDQREVNTDTLSFEESLRHVLRQDPDVILIGELRDYESIQQALIIADTGHLVLATLHTSDSVQTINRMVDVFPSHQQKQIRTQLSFVLLGIISQQLLTRSDQKGRVLASEVLIATPSIRNLIREDKIHQLYSVMQTSHRSGMRTMNQSLASLHLAGIVELEDAVARSSDPSELMELVRGKS